MEEQRFDIIAVGDTTLDVFLELEDASVTCDIDETNCKLLLDYADKIPVKSVTQVPGGGNAANNAVGSARLGLKVVIYTIVGNDQVGQHIQEHLLAEGVATDFVAIDNDKGTNYSTILNYLSERTILVYHQPRSYRLPALPPAKWLYFSSVSSNQTDLQLSILDYVTANSVRLAFSPGTHQIMDGLEALKPVIQKSELLILNREEAMSLMGRTDDMKKLLGSFEALGAKNIVVTDAEQGTYALSGGQYYHQPILSGNVIERTGAGDAFASGLIGGLINNATFTDALRWGTINAWSVLQFVGSQQGLLSKDKLFQILEEHPELQPQVI